MKKINLLLLLAMISLKLLCQQDNEMVLDSMVTYEWDSENSEWNERNYSCFHGGCVGGQFEYQYDINGNQTEVIIFFRESETNNKINYLRIVFTYNAKGNQTELIGYEWDHETDDWIPSNVYSHMNPRGGRNVSHYDANENLTEEMFYFSDNNTNEWVYQRRVFYTYDARGNQTEEMLYAWDSETNNWRNYRRHVKTYDDNGNQAEYIPYSWNSETNDWQHCTWQDRRESNYDANGNLTEDIYYNWEYETSEWKNNRRYVYIYGSEGNQTEYFHYRGNEKTNDWKGYRHHIYAYDTNGNQTEDLEYWWSDYINDWVKKSQTIYTYDANGNTTGENSYEWEGEIIGWIKGGRVDYTYDSNGNQTEFTRYGWDREINDWIYEWKELSYWSYPLLPYQSFYVNENCSDSSILGTLITVSSYPQENITFNITGGDPDHIFSVDTIAGDVRLINSCDLDYETTSSYRLTVEAHFEDSTVKITDKAAIMIYVNNMNDNIPVVYDTIFSLYSKSHGGTIVGQVNARDADGNLNPHTFSIIEETLITPLP